MAPKFLCQIYDSRDEIAYPLGRMLGKCGKAGGKSYRIRLSKRAKDPLLLTFSSKNVREHMKDCCKMASNSMEPKQIMDAAPMVGVPKDPHMHIVSSRYPHNA